MGAKLLNFTRRATQGKGPRRKRVRLAIVIGGHDWIRWGQGYRRLNDNGTVAEDGPYPLSEIRAMGDQRG